MPPKELYELFVDYVGECSAELMPNDKVQPLRSPWRNAMILLPLSSSRGYFPSCNATPAGQRIPREAGPVALHLSDDATLRAFGMKQRV
jgi:hypothetical protein